MIEIDGEPAVSANLAALALSNYGHFTTMRVENGRVRGLAQHLDRLVRDCRALFGADLDPDRVRSLVRRAAAAAGRSPVVVRVTGFSPDLELNHPAGRLRPRLLVSTRAAVTGDLPPLRLSSVRYQREFPAVKHVGLFGTIHHRRHAQEAGFDDVVFVTRDGRVVEGATWNIGFLDGTGRLVWPRAGCLPGVTMQLLTGLAGGLGLACATRPVRLAGLPQLRAAFVANAAIGVRPVGSIDATGFDPADPALATLREAYLATTGEPV